MNKFEKAEKVVSSSIDPVEKIFADLNNDVVGKIVTRLESFGGLSKSDVNLLIRTSRYSDLNDIKKMIAKATGNSIDEIDNVINGVAASNDELFDAIYKSKGIAVGSPELIAIKEYAKKNIKKDLLNLSQTTAFVTGGKAKSIAAVYTEAVNFGALQVSTGVENYTAAIRRTVNELTDSGLRTVDFASGYSRRLDSQVRMNVFDSVRQMSQEYVMQQGKEFGADGIEISAHGLCATDHLPHQGKQFSKKEFDSLQGRLERPIGKMNCHHSIFPILMGVSSPAYSEVQLKEIEKTSTSPVEYTLQNGKKKTITRYEASQVQRKIETDIRRMSEKKLQFGNAKDDIMVKKYEGLIKEKKKHYKSVSKEFGLKARIENTRI